MDTATIGDDITPLYEFEWDNGIVRTSDELGDFESLGLSTRVDDIVDIARDDPECNVRVIGFE